ncbi:hypothetical protein HDU96_007693 [Phlyctochytrium bullatum]|nr:hypothetical protein HDU96_007693 [Phlyctochytrium bullatum]
MHVSYTIPTLVLAAALNGVNAAFTAGSGFTYTGVITGNNVQITISGKVDTGSYIALGVPRQDAAAMVGSDMYIAYASGSSVTVLEGSGTSNGGKGFGAATTPTITMVPTMSSLSNGTLTAVFTKPLAGPNGVAIKDGTMTYLWATGRMNGNTPTKHTAKGVSSNVNLIGAATTSGGSGVGGAGGTTATAGVAATTAANTTTKSGSAQTQSSWWVASGLSAAAELEDNQGIVAESNASVAGTPGTAEPSAGVTFDFSADDDDDDDEMFEEVHPIGETLAPPQALANVETEVETAPLVIAGMNKKRTREADEDRWTSMLDQQEYLRKHPIMQSFKELIFRTGENFGPCIAGLKKSQPELFNIVQDNHAMFLAILRGDLRTLREVDSEAEESSPAPEKLASAGEGRGSDDRFSKSVENLVAFGFDVDQVTEILLACDGDEQQAANLLFEMQ